MGAKGKRRGVGCIVGVVVVVTLLLIWNNVSVGMAIAPLTKTIQIAPGKSEIVTYRVYNEWSKPVELEISAKTWFSLPENANIAIEQWLKPEVNKLILGPKQEKKLKVKIEVPKDATGELAGMIYFSPKREKEQTLGTSYGVSLYVFVKGTERVEPALGDVLVSREGANSFLAVTIINKGNVHFRPRVYAIVTTDTGFKEEMALPFGKPIFGGQTKVFVEKVKGQLPQTGVCTVDLFCDYEGSKDTMLKKTATINLGAIK
jgi:hypothetical protein